MADENLLGAARLIRHSKPVAAWFALPWNKTERGKVDSELAGVRKPLPDSAIALGIVNVARQGYGNPPPPAKAIPKPFSGKGMVLLEPTGGTEDIKAAKDAGFTYLLLNVAYSGAGNWDVQRSRASQHGLDVVPWQRVRTPDDSHYIEHVASDWGSSATAHNLETEAVTSYPPAALAAAVKSFPARVRCVITEPWAQNSAGWAALKTWVGMPEAFMNAALKFTPAVCCEHLRNEGIPRCVPMFGWGLWADAHNPVLPAQYLANWNGPYSCYFGDGREPQYGEWK